MATLKLEIVTPEEKIYSEDVDMVTLPGSEGRVRCLPKTCSAAHCIETGRTARRERRTRKVRWPSERALQKFERKRFRF